LVLVGFREQEIITVSKNGKKILIVISYEMQQSESFHMMAAYVKVLLQVGN
jgi:hypothetical protein